MVECLFYIHKMIASVFCLFVFFFYEQVLLVLLSTEVLQQNKPFLS